MGNYLAKAVWPDSPAASSQQSTITPAAVASTTVASSAPAAAAKPTVAASPESIDRLQNDITVLMKSGSILDCGIISKADGKLLAKSKGFQVC